MASEMMEALMTLCQEKHIDELYLLDRLEQSLAKSYADVLHLSYGARVTIDRTTGKVYVYELVPQGEPDEETGEYTEFDEVDVICPSPFKSSYKTAFVSNFVKISNPSDLRKIFCISSKWFFFTI